MQENKRIAEALGHNTVAVLTVPVDGKGRNDYSTSLVIMTPSTWEDQGGVMPAESVTLPRKEEVVKLMGLLMKNVTDLAGFDYSIPRLMELCQRGVTIDIQIDVTRFKADKSLEDFAKSVCTLFNGAGFNISHNDTMGGEGPTVTITAEPMAERGDE